MALTTYKTLASIRQRWNSAGMVPAYKIEAISRMGNRLRSTLRRCDPPLPDSLRLMAAQVVKEGILRSLQGHTEIYPGMKEMARWGGCSERQARRNVRTMEMWGLVAAISNSKGGYLTTRYWVDPEAIIRVSMILGANPHPDLIAEIRDLRADIRADMTPGHMAGHMSAGIYNTKPVACDERDLSQEGETSEPQTSGTVHPDREGE